MSSLNYLKSNDKISISGVREKDLNKFLNLSETSIFFCQIWFMKFIKYLLKKGGECKRLYYFI